MLGGGGNELDMRQRIQFTQQTFPQLLFTYMCIINALLSIRSKQHSNAFIEKTPLHTVIFIRGNFPVSITETQTPSIIK